jgi:tetratricopeptide (TPR) repeat protein
VSRDLGRTASVILCSALALFTSSLLVGCGGLPSSGEQDSLSHLQRAKVYLAAADYRRAVDACQQEVAAHPSAEAYTYLTYVYQALDAYADSLARADQWVAMEHLYLNLAAGRTEDLVDPPDVLARIAKEMIRSAAQKQSDVTAALAMRLDPAAVARAWAQQTAWRKMRPDGWWFGVPPGWPW